MDLFLDRSVLDRIGVAEVSNTTKMTLMDLYVFWRATFKKMNKYVIFYLFN